MSENAVGALEAEVAHATALILSLTPEEWDAPSGCADWRVQDVVCHMASVFHTIADPSTIEGGSSEDAEENAEVPVQARRAWTTDQVIAEYAEWSAKGVAALTALQDPPMADAVVPLGNLGAHPLHILANAIVFDHYCHLRHDIGFALPRAAGLPQDEAPLAATLEWMLAGVPQMCAPGLAGVEPVAVNLEFSGPGGGSYVLAPSEPGELWTVTPGSAAGAATVTTSVHDFISWGTKRADWRTMTVADNLTPSAAAVIDALNVI